MRRNKPTQCLSLGIAQWAPSWQAEWEWKMELKGGAAWPAPLRQPPLSSCKQKNWNCSPARTSRLTAVKLYLQECASFLFKANTSSTWRSTELLTVASGGQSDLWLSAPAPQRDVVCWLSWHTSPASWAAFPSGGEVLVAPTYLCYSQVCPHGCYNKAKPSFFHKDKHGLPG